MAKTRVGAAFFLLALLGIGKSQNIPLVQGSAVTVAIEEFTIEGTPGFLITPDILTATLTEGIPSPFESIRLTKGEEPEVTVPLVLRGTCVLHEDHTLDLRLTLVSRFGDTLQGSYQNLNLDQAQEKIFGLLHQAIDTLTVITRPRGALISLDGTMVGAAPFRYFPVVFGTHVVQANFGGPKGLVTDTVRFPNSRTVVLTSPLLVQQPTTAQVLFKGDSPAEIWLEGKRLGNSDQGWIEVPPGEHTFEIVSPAFGTRQVTLKVEAGRKYVVRY